MSELIFKLKDYKYYLTHDNHSRPFCVYIDNNDVHVFKLDDSDLDSENYTTFVSSFTAKEIFIGKSPLNETTKYSAGHGPTFDGNSILLKIDTHEYVFIGDMIFSFKAKNEIVTFVSPVGNNDVPYPYAIDSENNYYFLLGRNGGVIKSTNDSEPYDYYYAVLNHIGESEHVECIYIGEEKFKITSDANPEKYYDSLVKRIGGPIYIKYKGEEERIISKNEYVQLLNNYNEKVGLTPLSDFKVIQKKYT
jgi:hypothetical protein